MSQELSGLPAISALATDNLLYVVDSDGNSRKVTLDDLAQWLLTASSIVPASEPFHGALVKRTSDLSVTGSSFVAIPWQSADYDTDGFWSAGSPTRLTIPAGVTKARAIFGWRTLTTGTINFVTYVWLSGGSVCQTGGASGFTDARCVIVSPVIEVVENDYFEALVFFSAGRTIQAAAHSFFGIEVVEMQP